MSRQASIEKYFKSKASTYNSSPKLDVINNKSDKKRPSLKKLATPSPKSKNMDSRTSDWSSGDEFEIQAKPVTKGDGFVLGVNPVNMSAKKRNIESNNKLVTTKCPKVNEKTPRPTKINIEGTTKPVTPNELSTVNEEKTPSPTKRTIEAHNKSVTPTKCLKVNLKTPSSTKRNTEGNTKPVTPSKYLKVARENANQSPGVTKQNIIEGNLTLVTAKNVPADVVCLCSDDEDIIEITPDIQTPCIDLTQEVTESESVSDCSENTIVYSPEKILHRTPLKSACIKQELSSTRTACNESQKAILESESSQTYPKSSTSTLENHTQKLCLGIKEEPLSTPQKALNSQTACNDIPQKAPYNSETSQSTTSSISSSQENAMQELCWNVKKELFSTPISQKSLENIPELETVCCNETVQRDIWDSRTPQKSPHNYQSQTQLKDLCISGTAQKSPPNAKTPEKAPSNTQTPQKAPPTSKTPQKAPPNLHTPQKAPHFSRTPQNTTQSSHSQIKSSQSRDKFFSPTRKKSVALKSPNKAKRSLNKEMSGIPSRILFEDDLFVNACKGMDDKTIFLLDIINKYLNEPSLRPLLDIESETLLLSSLQVVKPGMRLVCRLYWRKEGWYKKEQISQISSEGTEDIDDPSLQEMIQSLLQHKLIVQSSTKHMTFNELTAILKKDELVQICKELKLKISSKQGAIEALASFSRRSSNISHFLTGHTSSNSERVLQMLSIKAGSCYMLSELARNTLNKLYLLMYLGMDYNIIREKRLELVLIYDKIKRETYPIDKDMRLDNAGVVFKTKDDFERYVTAHNSYEEFMISTDLPGKCNTVAQVYNLYKGIREEDMASYKSLPPWLHRFTPANLYIKVLGAGVQDLKRDKIEQNLLLAMDILTTLITQTTFRQHKKADWYAEKALIQHSLLQYDEAAETLLEGFRSDMSEEAKDSMRPRARKIANQKNITLSEHLKAELAEYANKEAILEKNLHGRHIYKQPMDRTSKRGKVKFETRTTEERTVQDAEEYCISEYLCTGEFTEGEHWEGRIVSSIFFLLFWEIIYSQPTGAQGVFLSYYQKYPLDLFTDSFYANRKEIIDEWLKVIESCNEEKLLSILHCAWQSRPEHELSGLSRGGLSWEQVSGVTSSLGGRGVATVCRRLAADYRYSHSGFPDLTLWNPRTRRIKFVEVKTDSDKPSMKQIQWMQYLREHGIDTEFCYVGVHTTRQRCRVMKPEELPIDSEM